MIEAATPSPKPTSEAPRPETAPSFLDQMGRFVQQFATDVTKANDDAREQLGRSAMGHMLSGVAPLATGIVGEFALEKLFDSAISGDRSLGKGNRSPFTLLVDVMRALDNRPFLREVAKNVGVTVGYNQLVARPSEGALPPATAVDAGIAVGIDAVGIGIEKIGKKERVRQALSQQSMHYVKEGGKRVVRAATLANGPTVLGLRMMGEGVVALAKNYNAIQHARSHPNEPKPYRPPERKPWEQRDRGPGRDKMYYGQGGGQNDRYRR